MKDGEWQFRMQFDICSDTFKMLLVKNYRDRSFEYFGKNGATECAAGDKIDPAQVLWFYPDMVKAMFQGLWDHGYRPEGFKPESSKDMEIMERVLKAQGYHLEDVRRIAFKADEVD